MHGFCPHFYIHVAMFDVTGHNRDDNSVSGVSFHHLPVKDHVPLKQVSVEPAQHTPQYYLLWVSKWLVKHRVMDALQL